MILERHYDEEALIAMLNSGKDAISRDAHLAGCVTCSHNLEAYQVMSEVLGEKHVWDLADKFDEGAEKGAAAIRAFAETMKQEDDDAVALVDELVKLPRQWWMTTIEADERYGQLAVARRLVEVSEAKIDTTPVDAVELARGAVAVTDAMEATPAVLQVAGAAYRQYAYSLFYTGDYVRALESADHGQSVLEQHPSATYDVARLDIVRSLIYSEQKRYEDALAASRRAIAVFREFGDTRKLISALSSEAYLYGEMHQHREALAILKDVRARYETIMEPHEVAALFANIGSCESFAGRVTEAMQSLHVAAQLYADLGNAPEAARVNYSIGLLLAGQGKPADAKKRLKEAQAEFGRLGMVHGEVVAGLDVAEIALLENNFEEVEELCRGAIHKFETAGVAYSREALTALTFLREAAEQRRATQATVWHVRTYIRRLPEQPALLFAPAPLPPT